MTSTVKGCGQEMVKSTPTGHITASEAAQRAKMTRERIVRRIQVGQLGGLNRDGMWFVEERSLSRFIAKATQ